MSLSGSAAPRDRRPPTGISAGNGIQFGLYSFASRKKSSSASNGIGCAHIVKRASSPVDHSNVRAGGARTTIFSPYSARFQLHSAAPEVWAPCRVCGRNGPGSCDPGQPQIHPFRFAPRHLHPQETPPPDALPRPYADTPIRPQALEVPRSRIP
jgi:hypothetical protein